MLLVQNEVRKEHVVGEARNARYKVCLFVRAVYPNLRG